MKKNKTDIDNEKLKNIVYLERDFDNKFREKTSRYGVNKLATEMFDWFVTKLTKIYEK